nr:STM4014 family protein [Pirellula staleyi]
MSDHKRRWLILGNPQNRRVKLFQAALRASGQQRAAMVSYVDFLRGQVDLVPLLERLAQNRGILRIESPGEDFEVERLLIARGAPATDDIAAPSAMRLRSDPGRIRYPRQWLAGFSHALDEIQTQLQLLPGLAVQNHPDAIRTLFDKTRCHAHLLAQGVAVPRVLLSIHSYDQLLESMRGAQLSRVFVKLNGGSSSSGVVALSTTGPRPLGLTSLELVRQRGTARFYNNLRLRHYDREHDLRTILDFLLGQGAHVEEWLPKASQADRNFDLRVVTFAGQACHMVVRTSRSPLTNLHLGNRRGDLAALRQSAGARWKIVPQLCEQAAAAFPAALYVGWDLLVTPGFRRAVILEGNAFGDLLPGVEHHSRSTYQQAIASSLTTNLAASICVKNAKGSS